MSSKTNTAATKEAVRPALVPELRFPEFRGAEGWKQTLLADCLDYQQPTPYLVSDTKYSPAFKTPVLTAGKTFILGYTDEQHGVFSKGLPVIIFDDFTTATQFVAFSFKVKSSAMKILQAKRGADIKFMYETLQTISYEVGAHERQWICNFAPMLVPVPKLAEQQKIADCLSSLDELITAQARKVDALKIHKKGLMQQLFPREGETQPRLRFPEFQKGGEWEVKTLEAIAPLQRGFDLPSQEIRPGQVPIVYSNGPKGFHAEGMAIGPGLVTGRSGTIGKLHFIESGAYWPHNTSLWVTSFKGHVPKFVYYLFDFIDFLRFSSGSGVPTLNRNDAHSFETSVPPTPPEQQRIASCLSSLDNTITAEIKKLEALKTHKKGLMQQLFPTPEADEA
jgi:type I restriction enzyme S subunit